MDVIHHRKSTSSEFNPPTGNTNMEGYEPLIEEEVEKQQEKNIFRKILHNNKYSKISFLFIVSSLGMNILVFFFTCVMVGKVAPIFNDAQNIIGDMIVAMPEMKETLGDLKNILPKIDEALHILKFICNSPEFSGTCQYNDIVD